jgi:hypothetical protein
MEPVNPGLSERYSVWRKASKSRSSKGGNWFRPVSSTGTNGMGEALPDEGRKATRREKPLNWTNPECGSGME